MGLSLLESIRKLIRQDTVRIGGPVGNMHGAVRAGTEDETSGAGQSWLVLTTNGTELPTLSGFFDVFTDESPQLRLEPADAGKLEVVSPPGVVTLLRTVAVVDRTVSFNLRVAVPATGSVAAVYANGVLLRVVRGSSVVPVSLAAGKHVLYVLAVAPSITLESPASIQLIGETDLPRAPQWISVTTGYLDELAGTASNVLRWASDPEAGSYRVYRRQPTIVADLDVDDDGVVTEVTRVGAANSVALTMNGDQSGRLQIGAVLLANSEVVGIVTAVEVEEPAPNVFQTVVTFRLPQDEQDPPTELVGQLLYTGTFTEIARVSRVANTGVVEYNDGNVTTNQAYEYALRCTGLVDESILSSLSTVEYVVAGDVFPPGPIEFLPNYPSAVAGLVTVKFTTPEDLDYAGVNVYYRKKIENALPISGFEPYHVDSITGAVITADNSEFPASPTDNLVGYTVQFMIAPYERYRFEVTSNTASTLTVSATIPADVVTEIEGSATPVGMLIYKDTEIKTDYGAPNRQDELQFFADQFGLYYFTTFDRGGNEQSYEESVTWEYTAGESGGDIAPPVMALRQLGKEEQAYFYVTGTGTVAITSGGVATFSTAQGYVAGTVLRVNNSYFTITGGSNTTYSVTPGATVAATSYAYSLTNAVDNVVVELWAYDPTKPAATKFNGVTIYYQRIGQDSSPVALTPIPKQWQPFPDLVQNETVSLNVTTVLNSTTATTTSTASLKPGMVISGNARIPANTTIVTVTSATQFTMSAAATSAGTLQATTFTLSALTEAVLDNPAGTRSRFVLVTRNNNGIRVWAENDVGLTSDITTFIADLDSTPELGLETYIDPYTSNADGSTGSARFIAVADDDTQGFSWQVDSGSVTNVDTRTIKRVEVRGIPLGLGERKVLKVIPYGVYSAGPPVTLSAPGQQLEAELIRTPRSYVAFDNKDSDGNRSATEVTITFAMVPAPKVLTSGNSGTLSGSTTTGYTFTPSDSPGWTAGAYSSGTTSFFYLVLRPSGKDPVVGRVLSNTTTALTVSGIPDSYLGSGLPFQLVDGAVLWRRIAVGSATTGLDGFAPTAGKQVQKRDVDFEIEFFATKNGCYAENVRRVLVDKDDLPALSNFGYTKYEVGDDSYLQLGFGSFDDDCTYWEAYEKKGGWPTKGGVTVSTTTPADMSLLDRDFLRFSGSVDRQSYSRSMAGMTSNDVWYAIGIPKNSFGQAGKPVTATYTVGTSSPALTDLTLTPTVGATTVAVAWTANAAASSGAVVSVSASRNDLPNSTVTANSTVAGSYTLNVGETIVSSNGINRTWNVTAALAGGNTLTRSVTFQVYDPSTGGGTETVTMTASAQVSSNGTCYQNDCNSGLTDPHINMINYSVNVNGSPVMSYGSPYYVNIEYAKDFVLGTDPIWRPLAWQIPAAQRFFMDQTYCVYRDTIGGQSYSWRYRLTVVTSNNVYIGPIVTTNTVTDTIKFCTYDGTPGNET